MDMAEINLDKLVQHFCLCSYDFGEKYYLSYEATSFVLSLGVETFGGRLIEYFSAVNGE